MEGPADFEGFEGAGPPKKDETFIKYSAKPEDELLDKEYLRKYYPYFGKDSTTSVLSDDEVQMILLDLEIMQDIELLAQSAALLAGEGTRGVEDQLRQGARIGWIEPEAVARLVESYRLLWRVQSAARLLSGDLLDLSAIGQGGTAFLLRETGARDVAALETRIAATTEAAGRLIERALGRAPKLA